MTEQVRGGTRIGQWALACTSAATTPTSPLNSRAPRPRHTASDRYRGRARRCTIAGMTNLAGEIHVEQASPSPEGGAPIDLLGWARRLSDSAEAISRAAASPGADAAVGTALGQIEAALAYLERGTEEMEGLARARLTRATVLLGDPWKQVVVARTARDFEELARALANARRACEKVRQNAGPILAELTAA
jgi:hypothetical protein